MLEDINDIFNLNSSLITSLGSQTHTYVLNIERFLNEFWYWFHLTGCFPQRYYICFKHSHLGKNENFQLMFCVSLFNWQNRISFFWSYLVQVSSTPENTYHWTINHKNNTHHLALYKKNFLHKKSNPICRADP